MKRLTKFSSKIKFTYAVSAFSTCIFMLLANPITSNRGDKDGTFYRVVINGKQQGSVLLEQTATDIVTEVRKQLAAQSQDIVYMDYQLDIIADKKLIGKIDDMEAVKKNVYNELNASIVETKQKAYTVKIDDFSITLPSKEAVIELLNAAKNKYDEKNEFSIELVLEENKELDVMEPSIVKMEKSKNQADTVGNTEAAAGEVLTTDDTSLQDQAKEDGILSIGFEEEVEVVETYVPVESILDLDTAISMVTNDQEQNKIYEVASGDCLSVVAEKNNTTVAKIVEMNEQLDADSVIQIGDEIVVTVPEPELSVLVAEQTTYEEEYEVAVEYIENDSWYTTKQEVKQEGSTGYREVTAKITKRNGEETNREVLNEDVITEAVPTIIEIGTQEPPTFIKPITGGNFSSGFGKRWGKMHKGIDWSCPIGTAVKASCGGQVVSAGWSNGYGYCITIKHSDGKQTRYGHLSKILVSAGDNVSQGEKIALSGNTGRSTGPHIHFEIIENGSQVNPLNYLN
ncbi:murein DD-endopeptidase MepM/ murein hydrolase activator NlpD [Lachnotalea glycerini]|uniref:LysM peptidoglycan-binding domain-containing protein n=1 Tax=Lachnotalea glycerini TaxID=1763509 RepID=A0A318ENU1_9FIRM|nr:M23 family metallopeptidase [Lachnotalea glycerini]PXV91789.1 murein DD-endopeptidase MepM/ murein hydrolase activator NlpD [Lachnotalea glycerini]RDY31215.1 LysM peptidoglycan-binding domain-containing protein [Lachnotalea glycerini]